MEIETLKICTKCLVEKSIEEFPKHANYKGGHTTHCRSCLSIQSTNWNKNNKTRAYEHSRNSYRKNPDVKRNAKFKLRYGITLEDFNSMSLAQNHQCAICHKHKDDNKNGRLFVDHDHATGNIRELLCDRCNKAIGLFEDDDKLLIKATKYLKKHSK